MADTNEKKPGGLVVDFSPILAFDDLLEELEKRWSGMSDVAREKLQRMIWLHPNGSVSYYVVPEPPEPGQKWETGGPNPEKR